MANQHPGGCRRCGWWCATGAGRPVRDGVGWQVEHDVCPDVPASDKRRWTVVTGEGYGGTFLSPGEVLRTVWSAGNGPSADAVPGGRADGDRVSGVVVVTGCVTTYYADEAMSFGVGDESGTVFATTVRAATEAEAATLLGAEARRRRRALLAGRVRVMFDQADDGTRPPAGEVHLAGMASIPRSVRPAAYELELYLDAPGDRVVTARNNGADGDDWSRNNAGAKIATVYPLTPERRQLLADLSAEYGSAEAWEQARVEPAAVDLLVPAGWTPHRLDREVRAMTVRTAADAVALLARTPEQWAAAGWELARYGSAPPPAADAGRLADAGISCAGHERLRGAYAGIESQIAAAPPEVSSEPGLFTVAYSGRKHYVTHDPAMAARLVAMFPWSWRPGGLRHIAGLTPLHTAGDWQLWSDGAITQGVWQGERVDGGTPAGVTALGVVAGASADSVRAVPLPLRLHLFAATGHARVEVTAKNKVSHQWEDDVALTRHDVTLADGEIVALWEVRQSSGGWSGEEGDYDEESWVYLGEAEAREHYRDASAKLAA